VVFVYVFLYNIFFVYSVPLAFYHQVGTGRPQNEIKVVQKGRRLLEVIWTVFWDVHLV